MFEPLDELPSGAVEGRGHAGLLSPFHNRAVHEVDFGLTFCENVLQHAGAMFPWGIRTFLHELARVAVQLNAESAGHRLPFLNEIMKQPRSWLEAGRGAMMQQ